MHFWKEHLTEEGLLGPSKLSLKDWAEQELAGKENVSHAARKGVFLSFFP